MQLRICVAFIAGMCALVVPDASAGWGLIFEVRRETSHPWQTELNVPAVEGTTIQFRFGVYFDPDSPPLITTADGTGTAMALSRFTGSNESDGFGEGDAFQNVIRTIPSGRPELVQISGSTIGTTSVLSFGSHLFLGSLPVEPYTEVYVGEIVLFPVTSHHDITLRNKTFGALSAPGVAFYHSASMTNRQSAAPTEARVDIPAVIHVGVSAPCPADLNGDEYVNDADFEIFVVAYDLASCDDPSMPEGCPADFNADGFVDDADFGMFVGPYNFVICP